MTTLESWRIIVENEHNDVQKILDDWENEQQAALLTEKELDDKIAVLVDALGELVLAFDVGDMMHTTLNGRGYSALADARLLLDIGVG